MTELRIIIPDKAMVPSIATKPKGLSNNNKAMVTPISPKGAVNITKNTLEKLCSCTIKMVNTAIKNSGKPAATEAPPLADSSTAPPVSILTPEGKLALIEFNC